MSITEAAAATRRNQLSRGILYMVISTVAFAGVNAIGKWELMTYPVGEVAFYRSLFALVTVAVMILPRRGIGVLRTNRIRAHLQRGVSQFGSMTCMFFAFSLMPLGSAVAVSFAAPLITTLLSIVILKEKVGTHRWTALVLGLVGVIVIAHPGPGTLQPGALFALANAVLISSVAVAIRRMSATESAETMTLYQMGIITILTTTLLPFGFLRPSWSDVGLLAIAGCGNGIAQMWWTRSLSLAPPSAVVPFNYLSLVWAMILGFAVWGDMPTPDLILGAVIVVGSGLYILWRETLRRGARRRMPSAAPQEQEAP
ncbi:MAG TPA: DMT family transporter [Stellaceae bacterium]|jgi:drug/metabolite transporter (DMT)-like permease|nr:DMT family transporter [Stellaceae bacterium]